MPRSLPELRGQPERSAVQLRARRGSALVTAQGVGRASVEIVHLRSRAGPVSPAGEPLHDAAAQATPLEDTRPQAPDALQDVRADALGVPAVPRGEDAAPDLPQVRLLQGPGSPFHRGRVTTGRAGR